MTVASPMSACFRKTEITRQCTSYEASAAIKTGVRPSDTNSFPIKVVPLFEPPTPGQSKELILSKFGSMSIKLNTT